MTVLGFGIVRGTEIVFRDEAERGRLGVSLLRTLRLPDDGVRYPLPPGMGPLPLRRVQDLKGRVPPEWLAHPGVVVPMYRCEAIWLLFSADHPLPHAVKVGCGGINALSGRPLTRRLERPAQPGLWRRMLGAAPAQDYAVCPPQQFIDGFNTGHHSVRQFVAVPLGEGRTVEAQVTGAERHGGIQLCVYPPRRELEAALASAGRLALPGLVPVTATGGAAETETAPWEWNGPGGAATPLMPPDFPPDGVHASTIDLDEPSELTDSAHAATVDLVTPAGSPDGAYAATVDLVTPAGSPGTADTTMVDVAAQAPAVDTPRDDSPITLRGYPASPDDLPQQGSPPQTRSAPQTRGAPQTRSEGPTRGAPQARRVQPTPFAGPVASRPRPDSPAPAGARPPAPAPSAYARGPAFRGTEVRAQAANPPGSAMVGAAAGPLKATRAAPAGTRVQPTVDRPLGLGAGGQIIQRIYTDVHGIETWDEAACIELFIHIVSPRAWYAMTGEPPPPTPVTFRAYQAAGLPWFQIYDEDLPGIAASPELERIRPVDDFDRRR